MTADTFRRLDTSAGGRREAFELLQLLLMGETVYPSDEIWLVARNLPDIDLFDNRSAAFAAIEPLWEHRWLSASEVLTWLHGRLSKVTVVLDRTADNHTFGARLKSRPGGSELRVIRSEEVVEEILIADSWILSGPLAPAAWDEGRSLYLDRDPERCRQALRQLHARYGRG